MVYNFVVEMFTPFKAKNLAKPLSFSTKKKKTLPISWLKFLYLLIHRFRTEIFKTFYSKVLTNFVKQTFWPISWLNFLTPSIHMFCTKMQKT